MSLNRAINISGDEPVHWKISLFGGMKVTRNEQPIASPPYRTYGLLAFLLLREGLPIRRERLGGLLYGDLPESKVRRRISDYVWQIRKHLPEFPLLTTTDTIGLNRRPIWVDVKAFQKEVNQPDDPLSERFIELYQGELLPELYDEWILVERERWRSQYLRSLRILVNSLLAAGKLEVAISRMERLLREEPYDEATVRLLMDTYSKIGRRGAALAAYEKFYTLSTEQIGLEPDAKTKQTYESIKSQATTSRHIWSEDGSLPITPTNPDEILWYAQFALEQGNRSELKRLLDMLPKRLSYEQALSAHLMEFDKRLLWGELAHVETILKQYDPALPALRLRQAKLAFAKHDLQEAKVIAETLLDDAHQLRQPPLEAEALLILSMVNTELGKAQDALSALDRVISLARKTGLHTIHVQACIQKGKYWRLKGAEESAQDTLEQASSLARRHNLRPLLAEVLNELGANSNYYGKYQASLKYSLESLEIARDLDLSEMEASILLTLSGTFDFLGRHAETAGALMNACRIYEERQDAFGLARCHYNLAYSFMSMKTENLSGALEYAEKALQFFRATNNLGWQASTQTALGYCHWLAGHADQAIENIDTAIKLHTELGEFLFIPENYAYKGLAYLQKGDVQHGLECTQFAVRELARRNFSDVAAEIYYAHACVALALGNEKETRTYIRLGYETYLEFAKNINDDDARTAYFERDPITRRLMKMAYDLGIAPMPQKKIITRELPGFKRYKVKLELTADAGPADQALGAAQGFSALRRARLRRILKEGDVHGGQLAVKELAKLFNVSPRTIRRDLKILGEEQKGAL